MAFPPVCTCLHQLYHCKANPRLGLRNFVYLDRRFRFVADWSMPAEILFDAPTGAHDPPRTHDDGRGLCLRMARDRWIQPP